MGGRNRHFTYKYWTIAYRKKGDTPMFKQATAEGLTLLNRRKSGIQADPFLLKAGGKNWLFYESAGPITGKGKIVCADLDAAGSGAKTVLKERFHFSYPMIFCCGGQYYMIPETKQNHRITLYRAVSFPWEWEVCRDLLLTDAVDTTVFCCGGQTFLFSYAEGKLQIYRCVTDGQGVPVSAEPVSQTEPSKRKRPGGNFYKIDGEWYRPAQLCENFYGEALVFNRVVSGDGGGSYSEEETYRLEPSQFQAAIRDKVLGIHTYNADEDYEVVDLYCEQYGMAAFLKKLVFIPLQCLYELYGKIRR